MKLPQLLKSPESEAENRKRALQRREMGQAYRKNAQYQAPKNPLLEALENLLSGKTERDLHTSRQAEESVLNTLDSSYQELSVTAEKTTGSADDEKVKTAEPFIDSFTEQHDLQRVLFTGQQSDSRAQHHLFKLASTHYLQHIAMVKNNYRPFDESAYSKLA